MCGLVWGSGKIGTSELFGPFNEIENKFAPKWLYISGHIEIAKTNPKVSVVGSRKPTKDGLKNTEKVVEFLLERDSIIVSGLAYGIDTMAHKTAIKNSGKTIAVLGTPINNFYPKENTSLQKEIMRNHLAISQFETGTPIRPKNFPIRNRTMALISNATIIVEAQDGSGSISQGWEALRLGRPLFILDSIVENKKLKWPYEMLKYGAEIVQLEYIFESFELLPPPGRLDVNVILNT